MLKQNAYAVNISAQLQISNTHYQHVHICLQTSSFPTNLYWYTHLHLYPQTGLQGKQVDVRQTCEKYIFSCCRCICKKEMSNMRIGTIQTVIALLVLLPHCTITAVEHYLQNVSSIVPPYMHHLCQCTPSIVDFSLVLDLVRRDILHENNKGTEFHTHIQLVMSIKIYVNDTCNKILVGQSLSDKSYVYWTVHHCDN